MKTKILTLLLSIAVIFCITGDYSLGENTSKEVILATTTSVYDTGLLDILGEKFTEKTGFILKPLAVGTGEALAMASRGEADVVLVHNKKAELHFVEEGYGINREEIMHNYFIITGPKEDPAGVKNSDNAIKAFENIAEHKSTFVSRGDDSGTNKKELSIWDKLSLTPSGSSWYIETGQGMAATLRIANEKNAYTLTDTSSYTYLEKQLDLVILLEEDEELINKYSIIEVNPEKFDYVNKEGAELFSDFLISEEIQLLISEYGTEEFGHPLFIPDRL